MLPEVDGFWSTGLLKNPLATPNILNPLYTPNIGIVIQNNHPQLPNIMTQTKEIHVTNITSNIKSVSPGADKSSPEVFNAFEVASYLGRPVFSRTNSAIRDGMEKIR